MDTDHQAYIQQELQAYKELSDKLDELQKSEPLYKLDNIGNVIKQYPDGNIKIISKRND